MSHLARLIASFIDANQPMNKKDFAAKAGITPQTLSGYLGETTMKEYPARLHMQGLADAMGVPYGDVLDAITLDLGHQVSRQQVRPDVAVTIASLEKLSPQRVKALGQMIAAMGEED